ncbi:hypothetical protein RCO27_10680 [Sphingosinicella sp. LHD-64]|uniref:hypothetical protein n=1 Tax=Sphingosinicella sp. LHD-64 TaxID=3072139 RepID=UPI00280F3E41|nr:hypothetical protein [Sphingosinicella sp. LHD-64]MDQ8756693.1 hypothetical protein [Sphingosinicella sp. LHD-64]
MPRHDPVPPRRGPDYERAAVAWAKYRKFMARMILLSVIVAGLAIAWLALSGEPLRLHMVIATFAGVALMVLVGTGLMGLVFLSNRTGHDEDAAHGGQDDDRHI